MNPERYQELFDALFQSFSENDKITVSENENVLVVFSLLSTLMDHVETLQEKIKGIEKKEIVIAVGRHIINKYFPGYIHFYDENANAIIEGFIQNFYNLIKYKKIVKCCL